MEPTRCSGAGNSGTYTREAAETLRFEEEIQSLMRDNLINHGLEHPPPANGGSSFTALLGLPPSQAVQLLHKPEPAEPPGVAPSPGGGEMWRQKALRVPLGCSPTFPSNAALVERAARFSVFAAEDSTPSNSGDRSPPKPKAEPADYGDLPIPGEGTHRPGKRRDGERSKVRGRGGGTAKKSRSAEEDTGGEKLPFVHVRARRGQATDSHSLAERARREKINARMKLLRELVPGCSKVTGTALVLDEIINHVQSLQRQVEFLSMRLAAVNPRIDFSGLGSLLSAECGQATAINGRSGLGLEQPLLWSEGSTAASNGMRRQQQSWHVDVVQQQQGPSACWERGDDTTPHAFISPAASLFGYDSASSVSLPNQLKTRL